MSRKLADLKLEHSFGNKFKDSNVLPFTSYKGRVQVINRKISFDNSMRSID